MRQHWNALFAAAFAILLLVGIVACSTIVLRESGDSEKETTEAPKSLLGGIKKGGDDGSKELRDLLDEANAKIKELEKKLGEEADL